jgi:hypothetical protein
MQLYGMDAGSADRILTTHVGSLIRLDGDYGRLAPSTIASESACFLGTSVCHRLCTATSVCDNPAASYGQACGQLGMAEEFRGANNRTAFCC